MASHRRIDKSNFRFHIVDHLSVVKFLGYRCNASAGDWSCVITWRSFAGTTCSSNATIHRARAFGAKRTRILTIVSGLAIAFDCFLIDMMA
jgi:hypothetical protein